MPHNHSTKLEDATIEPMRYGVAFQPHRGSEWFVIALFPTKGPAKDYAVWMRSDHNEGEKYEVVEV